MVDKKLQRIHYITCCINETLNILYTLSDNVGIENLIKILEFNHILSEGSINRRLK